MLISGLIYLNNFVSPLDEAALLSAVDAQPWQGDLKRRVQQYGFHFDYTTRAVDASDYLGRLPNWAKSLTVRLVAEGHMTTIPNQMIVNEYLPGQGINPHIDSISSFGPIVCSVTLGSHCVMDLSHATSGEAKSLVLERGSLLVLSGDARYKWRHGIPGRMVDQIAGLPTARARRVSLTFRTVVSGEG